MQEDISTLVLRVSARYPYFVETEDAALAGFLTSAATRNEVFLAWLELTEIDPQRRDNVGPLLLHYVPGFPPSREVLLHILEKCKNYSRMKARYAGVYAELERVVEEYLSHKCLGHMLKSAAFPVNSSIFGWRQDSSTSADHRRKVGLQFFPRGTGQNTQHISVASYTADDITIVTRVRNANLPRYGGCPRGPIDWKDYIHQLALECTEEMIEQQCYVLTTFWDGYRGNRAVFQATSFLIKLLCDGYVSKIPLGGCSSYALFRSVSVCYLPLVLDLMKSDYLCVRNHAYDFLLTLGAHLQLVDSQGVYPGCTEALQHELVWLLLNVLRRQALIVPSDEMTWLVAAKCALAVVPRSLLHLIDCRALHKFMCIPQLSELYPELFSVFAEALVCSLLKDKRPNVPFEENLLLDADEFAKLGSSSVSDLIALYRRSWTVGARRALFHILFVISAHRICASAERTGREDRPSPPPLVLESLQQCYLALVALDFFWTLHSLLFYTSHRTLRHLAEDVLYDADWLELREHRSLTMRMVQAILHLVEEDTALPRAVAEDVQSVLSGAPSSDRTAAVVALSENAVAAIPLLLGPEDNAKLYNVCWRLAFLCLRGAKEYLRPEACNSISERLAGQLVCCSGSTESREKAFSRRVCPDILHSLAVLGHTQASQAVDSFNTLLEKWLLGGDREVDSLGIMTLYSGLLECVALFSEELCRYSSMTDISTLVMSHKYVVPQVNAEGVGARVLWALYRGLSGVQSNSACRARYVLISLLAGVHAPAGIAAALSWRTVLADPYPPIAFVAARTILQNYRGLGSESNSGYSMRFAKEAVPLLAAAKKLVDSLCPKQHR